MQIDAIGQYIADEGIDSALKVIDALEEAFGRLAANPGIGAPVRISPAGR